MSSEAWLRVAWRCWRESSCSSCSMALKMASSERCWEDMCERVLSGCGGKGAISAREVEEA